MSLLYPLFLSALAVLAVPIIIHLFNFKRFKKIYFPDIRFLKEIQEQTQKQSKLKHILVLCCRLLAFTFLVLAFAQPYFNKDKQLYSNTKKAISIYIDNSFSMSLEQNGISMLELAKSIAKNIISQCNTNDKINVITNEYASGESSLMDKNDALQFLSTIQISPVNKKPTQILEKQKNILSLASSYFQEIFFISDFQKNNFRNGIQSTDSIKKTFISVKPTARNNISIDTVLIESLAMQTNEEATLAVVLNNNSEIEANTQLTLQVNNQLKSVSNIVLKAGEHKTEKIKFTPTQSGYNKIATFISDYPMSADDTFYIAANINAQYAVLIVNQNNANAFLSSVFKPGNQFKADHLLIQNLKTDILKNYSLVILNSISSLDKKMQNALNDYLFNGGNVLCFAPGNQSLTDMNEFLLNTAGCSYSTKDTNSMQVSDFNKSHVIFSNMFEKIPSNIELPVVYKRNPIQNNAMSASQKLFTFSNGEAFLSSYKSGNGNLYVCASGADITQTNFPKSYWFLPVIYNMALNNKSSNVSSNMFNQNMEMLIDNANQSDKNVYHLISPTTDAIPEQRIIGNKIWLQMQQCVKIAGFYDIKNNDNNLNGVAAINYDRSESILEYMHEEEMKNASKMKNAFFNTGTSAQLQIIQSSSMPLPLWKLSIIFAIAFLLIETLLIRFWK